MYVGCCPHNLKLVGLVDLFYLSYSFSHSSRARKTHQTPHPSPHFASARAVVKASVLATAALNACNSGASLCSGMFGISS